MRHDSLNSDHTLVVVFLRGGADGLSIVPPVGVDAYHRARPSLRIRSESAIRVDERFGLHPELAPLERHLREGRLAIVHGAGSQDTTRSHFEAQDFMEHGGEQGGGWLARYLRARGPTASALAAVAIGATQPESLRGAPSGAVVRTVRDFAIGGDDPKLMERLALLYGIERNQLGDAGRATIDAVGRLAQLRERDPRPASGASYPEGAFGRGLAEIAKLIKADVGMVATTIDMVGGGLGWDTHFVQGQAMSGLVRELAQGLDAFWIDLDSHRQRTTVVVMTEFGRRVGENTSLGTDHGAGSVMFVMGEALGSLPTVHLDGHSSAPAFVPGRVVAGWSDLEEGSLIGPGDVPVTTDYRAVLCPILRQHAPEVRLESVFPGLVLAQS